MMEKREDYTFCSIIKPESFYNTDEEKIKFNWFLYELALSIESGFIYNKPLLSRLKKYFITKKNLSDFSIYASKVIKTFILEKLEDDSKELEISFELVESYFPNLRNVNLINEVLDIVGKQYDEMLGCCENCPTRCISERFLYCTLFDDGPYYNKNEN